MSRSKSPSPSPTARAAALLVLTLLAFAFRVGLSAHFQGLDSRPDPNLGLDHIQYAWTADQLLQGKGYILYNHRNEIGPSAFRAPGTPFLLYAVYKLTGQSRARVTHDGPAFAAVRIAWALFGALSVPLLYLIALRALPVRLALLAAALFALWPAHAYYSMHLYSEVPWTFVVLLAVWLGLKASERPRAALFFLQGLFFGYAALLRPIAFPLPFLQSGLLLLFHRERFRLFPRSLLAIAACLLVIFPWALRNHRVFGHWVLFSTHGGTTLYGAYNETVAVDPALKGRWLPPEKTPRYAWIMQADGEIAWDERAYEAGWEWISEHPRQAIELIPWKFWRSFGPHPGTPNRTFNYAVMIPYLLILPFFAAGLFRQFRGGAGLWIPLSLPLLITLAMTVFFYGDHRFRIAISPFLILWALIGAHGVKPSHHPKPR
jgi:4-amino-4-deoxy-L-arabinose transferase-like glycosyltransferase